MVPLAPGRTWVECSWLVAPAADGSPCRTPRARSSSGTSRTGRTGRPASPCSAGSPARTSGRARSRPRGRRRRPGDPGRPGLPRGRVRVVTRQRGTCSVQVRWETCCVAVVRRRLDGHVVAVGGDVDAHRGRDPDVLAGPGQPVACTRRRRAGRTCAGRRSPPRRTSPTRCPRAGRRTSAPWRTAHVVVRRSTSRDTVQVTPVGSSDAVAAPSANIGTGRSLPDHVGSSERATVHGQRDRGRRRDRVRPVRAGHREPQPVTRRRGW